MTAPKPPATKQQAPRKPFEMREDQWCGTCTASCEHNQKSEAYSGNGHGRTKFAWNFTLWHGCRHHSSHSATIPAITAWAIKGPDGAIDLKYINQKKSKLIDEIGENVYNCAIDEGYRCVRVQIREVEE